MTSERSDGREMALPITSEGVLRVPPRIRERYLTPDVDQCLVQATGSVLSLWFWSERENVRLDLPFDGHRWGRPYTRSVSPSWGVNVDRWRSSGVSPRRLPDGTQEGAALRVDYGSQSQKEMIDATAYPFDGDKPEL